MSGCPCWFSAAISLCDFHHAYVQHESGLLGSRFLEQDIGSQVCRMSTALPCPEVGERMWGRMYKQPAVEQLEKGRPLEESAPRVLPARDCPLCAGIKAGSGSFISVSFLLLVCLYSVKNQILLNNQLLQLHSTKEETEVSALPRMGLPVLRRAGDTLPPDLKLSHLRRRKE